MRALFLVWHCSEPDFGTERARHRDTGTLQGVLAHRQPQHGRVPYLELSYDERRSRAHSWWTRRIRRRRMHTVVLWRCRALRLPGLRHLIPPPYCCCAALAQELFVLSYSLRFILFMFYDRFTTSYFAILHTFGFSYSFLIRCHELIWVDLLCSFRTCFCGPVHC